MVKLIPKFYSDDLVALMAFQTKGFKENRARYGVREDREQFFRLYVREMPTFRTLHHLMLNRVESILGRKLRPTYCFISMYDDDRSVCPPHSDNNECQWTLTIAISQHEVWPFFIDGTQYDLTPGDGLLYSGTDSRHWREQIQPGNRVDLALFHFIEV